MQNNVSAILDLFPLHSRVDNEHALITGNLSVVELVKKYGSPLYIYDHETIRSQYEEFKRAFQSSYPTTEILYASKVFLNIPFAQMLYHLGVKFDVVSFGEMSMLMASDIPLSNAYFHGNNKTEEEIKLAIKNGIDAIVIDNIEEVNLVNSISKKYGVKQKILLRVTPNIDPYTHEKTTTGLKDSKFGLSIEDHSAEDAIELIATSKNLSFVGIHAHLGSPINFVEPYQKAIDKMFTFIKFICIEKYSLNLTEFSPGGGFGVISEPGLNNPTLEDFANVISEAIRNNCEKYDIDLPKVFIEPGRSLVARSGVAVYQVGSRKTIPEIRTYLSVDGGMADNIRPTLYDAKYFALPVQGLNRKFDDLVTVSGKYCESGDYLIKDIYLPKLLRDEYIAMPMSGAYQLAMSSNYNLAYKPAVILIKDSTSKLLRKRENINDIIALDII
ncbi:MAG: diaminopimelate decarboxylase [Dehalococcoidia bacterium]|nr:diaminopimelate decarboxylase [Dehalococcoidia bacterium]